MFRSIAARSTTLASAATVAAGFVLLLSSAAPDAKAAAPVFSSVAHAFPKSDRLPSAVFGAACSSLSWPHYEKRCQFDHRGIHDARVIRIIALRHSGE